MDAEKLKEAILYLSYLAGGKPNKLGKTRLYKILWFFEGMLYVKTGEKPLGLKFIKNKYGPVSEEIDKMLRELKSSGLLNLYRNIDGNWIIKTASIPEIKKLSKQEIELLSSIYTKFSSMNAKAVSSLTHASYWNRLPYGEEMNPIFVLENFITVRKPTDEEMEEIKRMYELYKKGDDSFIREIEKELEMC